jgi:tetratricopeptide (TPR) repeat protein
MNKGMKRLLLGCIAGSMALSLSLPVSAADAVVVEPAWRADFSAAKLSVAKGESAKAKELLQSALKTAEAAKDGQGIAEICNELANIYLAEGDIINASANAKRAKDEALTILMADPRTRTLATALAANEENGAVWINHMMKAQFAMDKKDYKEAEVQYRAAGDKAKQYASDGMPMASAMAGLGHALVEQGKWQEAEPVLRQAIELCEKNWTPVTKNSALDAADAMDRLSVVLEKTGRKDEAAKVAAKSKEVRETKALKNPNAPAAPAAK